MATMSAATRRPGGASSAPVHRRKDARAAAVDRVGRRGPAKSPAAPPGPILRVLISSRLPGHYRVPLTWLAQATIASIQYGNQAAGTNGFNLQTAEEHFTFSGTAASPGSAAPSPDRRWAFPRIRALRTGS